jgi:hypothetical protein
MAEERRNPGLVIQMASTFPLILYAVDLTPPLAENASAEDALRNLALQIQEAEVLGFRNPLRPYVTLFEVRFHFGILWAEAFMCLP